MYMVRKLPTLQTHVMNSAAAILTSLSNSLQARSNETRQGLIRLLLASNNQSQLLSSSGNAQCGHSAVSRFFQCFIITPTPNVLDTNLVIQCRLVVACLLIAIL